MARLPDRRRVGKGLSDLKNIPPEVADRFWKHVEKQTDEDGGHWLWMAYTMPGKGYGQFRLNGISERAHRVAWALEHGSTPEGKQLLHGSGCPTNCIRPNGTHMREGTNDMNVRDRYVRDASEDELYDMSETCSVPLDWEDERLLRFADYFGYTIEPNPKTGGMIVISPSGKHLGGWAAQKIIDASQRQGEGPKAAKVGGLLKAPKAAGGKKASTAKTSEQKLSESQAKGTEAIAKIDTRGMEDRSKGKLKAADMDAIVSAGKKALADAKSPEEARKAVSEMKTQLASYKKEMTKPPGIDVQTADTVRKLKDNLPNATVLAGVSYDPSKIQDIINKHTKAMDGASTPTEAQAEVKAMRLEVLQYKVQAAKDKAADKAAKAEAVKQATAATKAAKSPKLGMLKMASEWASYYVDAMNDAIPAD